MRERQASNSVCFQGSCIVSVIYCVVERKAREAFTYSAGMWSGKLIDVVQDTMAERMYYC